MYIDVLWSESCSKLIKKYDKRNKAFVIILSLKGKGGPSE